MGEGNTFQKTRSVFRLFGKNPQQNHLQFFPGIIAKDGIILQNLRGPHLTKRKSQEPGYELPINGETNVLVRDREPRNQENLVQWKNQCKLLDNLGPTVDGVPWDEADKKIRS